VVRHRTMVNNLRRCATTTRGRLVQATGSRRWSRSEVATVTLPPHGTRTAEATAAAVAASVDITTAVAVQAVEGTMAVAAREAEAEAEAAMEAPAAAARYSEAPRAPRGGSKVLLGSLGDATSSDAGASGLHGASLNIRGADERGKSSDCSSMEGRAASLLERLVLRSSERPGMAINQFSFDPELYRAHPRTLHWQRDAFSCGDRAVGWSFHAEANRMALLL
jgi:hypothetical protein